MKRLVALVLGSLIALATAGSAGAITPKLPVSTSLTTGPSSVSWPGSREFEYRVDMTAGPDGSHFIFTVPQPAWGFSGVQGSPFSYFPQPTLDGPGRIKPSLAIVADPLPWGCWRGAFSGTQSWYEIFPIPA